jgi:hypothetical protein
LSLGWPVTLRREQASAELLQAAHEFVSSEPFGPVESLSTVKAQER